MNTHAPGRGSTPDPAADTAAEADLQALLGPAAGHRPWWRRAGLWVSLALVGAAALAAWYWAGQRQAASPRATETTATDTARTSEATIAPPPAPTAPGSSAQVRRVSASSATLRPIKLRSAASWAFLPKI